MKLSKIVLTAVMASIFAMSSVLAADDAGQLVRFKAGEVSFTLLQSDGVTPMKDAELKMLASDDSRVLAEAVSDHLGQAAVALSEGRYLLNVSGRTLSVLDVASDATLTSCRVVVPAAALMVAGQEEEEEEETDEGVVPPVWLKPVVIGGVVVLVAGGGYAIYESNNDDDDDDDGSDDELPPPPPPPPTGGDDDDDDDGDDDDDPTRGKKTPDPSDEGYGPSGPSAI